MLEVIALIVFYLLLMFVVCLGGMLLAEKLDAALAPATLFKQHAHEVANE